MGGSSFGKVVTKVVDPFNLGNSKFVKSARKIIDPLNIMDPLNVLPGSGKPVGTWDKNFGAPVMNWLNPKQSSYAPMTKGLSSNPQYFAQQQKMLQNLKASSDLDIARKQASNARLASSNPSIASSPNEITKLTSEPLIIPANPQINQSSNQSMPSAYNLAQTKITDNISPSDLPMDFSYKPSNKEIKVATANTFQMPDMSSIKFGGA